MRHVVQGVGPRLQRYFDRPWRDDEARRSELVIIGESGMDVAAIRSALAG
jgi:cobalamin biosynthesis protein CobW